MDYLETLVYSFALEGRTPAGDIATQAIEEEEEHGLPDKRTCEHGLQLKKMDDFLKKMDALIMLCRDLLVAVVVLIAIFLYVAIAK